MDTERVQEKRQFGHRARLVLTPARVRVVDGQAHAARTLWNLLHDWWTMTPRCRRSLAAADTAIRQARKEIDWQHKTTTAIADRYGTVVLEALTITSMVKSTRGTLSEPGKHVAQKAGLNRSISQEAWGRTVTMLTYRIAQRGGTLIKVPAPGTSLRCSACGFTTPGSRESQAVFVCKNPDCGFQANADWNAARNVLHLYRIGHVAIPAAGRRSRQARQRVKPLTAK